MSSGDPFDAVERLFLEWRCEEALSVLDAMAAGAGATHTMHAWRRRVLANLGRHDEAVDAAAAALADGGGTPHDRFRLGEVLARAGRMEQALDTALEAFDAEPGDPRPLAVALEAALAEPALMARLRDWCDARRTPGRPTQAPPDPAHRRVLLPGGRRFCIGTDADHPEALSALRAAGVNLVRARSPGPSPVDALAAGLDRCERAVRGLMATSPRIDRPSAGRYVGQRALSLLDDADGAVLDLLTVVPMTLGQRPYLLLLDLLSSLFQPFLPFNRMTVDGRRSPLWHIVRAWLESPWCVGVYSPYAGAGAMLGAYFDSPAVSGKCAMVDHLGPDSARSGAAAVPAAARRDERGDGPPTLLFTASAVEPASKFLLRGGVYALCAFRALAERFPTLRMVMRSPLPAVLDPGLADFARSHGRITVIEETLTDEDYRELFATSDVFLSPSAALYMNSTVTAMRFGAVPVVSAVFGADELVRHGETGLLVPLACAARIDTDLGVLEQDFRSFQRLDGPGDPAFFADVCRAVAGLLDDRPRLRSMSRRAVAEVAAGLPHRPRGEPMADILGRGLSRAIGLLAEPAPLFADPPRRENAELNGSS